LAISHERAERVAKAHACVRCREYSYKRLVVKPATEALREEFGELWHAVKVCGVCGLEQELGIDQDGDILYAS
jgi:hypothetical protein